MEIVNVVRELQRTAGAAGRTLQSSARLLVRYLLGRARPTVGPQLPLHSALRQAWIVGRSALFDPVWYLQRQRDVAASGIDPLVHYLLYGASEGRDPHPLFDSSWYLERNRDVAAAGANPVAHYLQRGWREGRDPHPLFRTAWYLERYPDVAATGANPLVHYIRHGGAEGRDPHPLFDVGHFLQSAGAGGRRP